MDIAQNNCPYDNQHCAYKELKAWVDEAKHLEHLRKTRSTNAVFCSDDVFYRGPKCPLSIFDRTTCIRYLVWIFREGKKREQRCCPVNGEYCEPFANMMVGCTSDVEQLEKSHSSEIFYDGGKKFVHLCKRCRVYEDYSAKQR